MLVSLLAPLLISLTSASLIIDYKAGDPLSAIGCPDLKCAENEPLGCNIGEQSKTNGGSKIASGQDSDTKPALHFHREPDCRRAEVKVKGDYGPNKKYYFGYEFRLSNIHQHLALFQWKKDKEEAKPIQNIPFNIQFDYKETTRLTLGYTPPDKDYQMIWTMGSDFDTSQVHKIALAWDTMTGGNSTLRMWLDGQQVVDEDGLSLWTGDTYPKLGIYRGEKGDHDRGTHGNEFDLWVYRVALGDGGLDEVAEAGGIQNSNADGGKSKLSKAERGIRKARRQEGHPFEREEKQHGEGHNREYTHDAESERDYKEAHTHASGIKDEWD